MIDALSSMLRLEILSLKNALSDDWGDQMPGLQIKLPCLRVLETYDNLYYISRLLDCLEPVAGARLVRTTRF
jgi:hypothetical protein